VFFVEPVGKKLRKKIFGGLEFYGLDRRKTRLIIENCPHFAAHDVTLFPVPFFLRFVFVAARHTASAAGGCCSFCSMRGREETYISLRDSSPSSNNNGRWGCCGKEDESQAGIVGD
jgi:hypothetical protein